MIRIVLCSVFGALALSSTASAASEVVLAVKTDRTSYNVGDTVRFVIEYSNRSNRTIFLLPQSENYAANILDVRDDRGGPTEKLHFGEASIAWDALAEEVKRLQPGEKTTRVVLAEIRSNLPPWFHDTRKGIFLILPASAIRLPAAATYEVRVRFRSSRDNPVQNYLQPNVKLWEGAATSQPIRIRVGG